MRNQTEFTCLENITHRFFMWNWAKLQMMFKLNKFMLWNPQSVFLKSTALLLLCYLWSWKSLTEQSGTFTHIQLKLFHYQLTMIVSQENSTLSMLMKADNGQFPKMKEWGSNIWSQQKLLTMSPLMELLKVMEKNSNQTTSKTINLQLQEIIEKDFCLLEALPDISTSMRLSSSLMWIHSMSIRELS